MVERSFVKVRRNEKGEYVSEKTKDDEVRSWKDEDGTKGRRDSFTPGDGLVLISH